MGTVVALVCIAGGVVAGLFMKGKQPVPATATPAAPETTAPVQGKSDTIQSKLLSTLVTLKNKGLQHLAQVFDAVWTNNGPALEKLAVVEAEHLAQGGPSLVLADLENYFAQELVAKLSDPSQVQSVLNTVLSTLGPNHPLLQQLLSNIVPAKPSPAGSPATIAKT